MAAETEAVASNNGGAADDAAPEPETEFAQELIVTAAHPELATESITLGREIEEAGSHDLGYFLRSQPGVSSFRRGAIGLDPQVRGLQETQVGVFVDGTRTFAAGPGRMDSDLAHVSPRVVERMRVIKGPYALTWGAGTLSAIQLETFRPAFGGRQLGLQGRVGGRYGANASTADGYAGVWGSSERLRYQALVQGRSGGDYEDGAGTTVPGDYTSRDARWSLGWQLGERSQLDYVGGYQNQSDVDYPGRLLDATYFYTRSHSLDYRWGDGGGTLDRFQAQLYVNRKDHLMNNDEKPTAQPNPDRVPPFGIDVALPTESNTSGGRVSLGGGSGSLSWDAGVDFYLLEQSARRFVSNRDTGMTLFEDIVWPDAEIEDLGTFVQLERAGESYTLAGSLRADFVDVTAGEVSEFFLDNTTGDLDQSETNWSAALSGRFQLDDAWFLTAGLGRAVRTASVLERYSDRFPSTKFQVAAEFLGDPGIEPETSLQADVGIEYRRSGLLLQIDAFYREIDDYITVAPDPSLPKRLPLSPDTVFRYLNGDKAEFQGGEIRLVHRASERVEWRGSATYVRGDDRLFDEPVFGLPPLTGQLGVRVSPKPSYWIDLNVTMADAQDRVASSRLEQPTPGYAFVDLLATFEVGSRWYLSLGAENVGDKLYANHLNSLNPFTRERISEQGLNLHVSAEYRF